MDVDLFSSSDHMTRYLKHHTKFSKKIQ